MTAINIFLIPVKKTQLITESYSKSDETGKSSAGKPKSASKPRSGGKSKSAATKLLPGSHKDWAVFQLPDQVCVWALSLQTKVSHEVDNMLSHTQMVDYWKGSENKESLNANTVQKPVSFVLF